MNTQESSTSTVNLKGDSETIKLQNTGTAITISSSSPTELPESIALTNLPSWPNRQHIRPNIVPPVNGERDLTIILNRESKAWNELSETRDEHFPAVVKRNLSSLEGGNGGLLERVLLRHDDVSGDISGGQLSGSIRWEGGKV